MIKNLIDKEPSFDKCDRDVYSSKIGIISILLAFFGILFHFLYYVTGLSNYLLQYGIISVRTLSRLEFTLTVLYYGGVILLAIFGLIKGGKELKSFKKGLAIKGIILCIASLVIAISLFFLNMLFILPGIEFWGQ